MGASRRIPHSRAFEIQEDLAAWLKSYSAWKQICTDHLDVCEQLPVNRDVEPIRLLETIIPEAQKIWHSERDSMPGAVPTFCSEDYGLMLATMANAVPKSSLSDWDFPSASGLLIFERPISVEDTEGSPDIEAIRALSWHTLPLGGRSLLFVRNWSERKGDLARHLIPSRTKLFSGGMTMSNLTNRTEATHRFGVTRLLQAHFALVKSSYTLDEEIRRDPKSTATTKRRLDSHSIRRVYLRQPEYARFEADEAAASKEGRNPVRAHGVRGHWRNQPYAALNIRRWIWIEGHPKGDPRVGTVSSSKIQVANAATSEVEAFLAGKHPLSAA